MTDIYLTESEQRLILSRRSWHRWMDAHSGLLTTLGMIAFAAIAAIAVL